MATRLHALRDDDIGTSRNRLARLGNGGYIGEPADAFLLHARDDCEG